MPISVSWRKYESKDKEPIIRSTALDTINGKQINEVWRYLKDELEIPENNIITRTDANGKPVKSSYQLKDGDELILETTYIVVKDC